MNWQIFYLMIPRTLVMRPPQRLSDGGLKNPPTASASVKCNPEEKNSNPETRTYPLLGN